MAVTRCEKGHFYDDEKFGKCPHCENNLPGQAKRGLSGDKTVFGISNFDVAANAMRQHVQVNLGEGVPSTGDEKTVGVFRAEAGCDPVVGWLVCVNGSEKGRDYRLHVGRNFVGRALKNDIALVDDERISREDHCSVVFEPKKCTFLLARGNGDGVIINGQRMQENQVLQGDETIEIGASTFVFIPYCKEVRKW